MSKKKEPPIIKIPVIGFDEKKTRSAQEEATERDKNRDWGEASRRTGP